MENNFGTWFHHQLSYQQSSNLNTSTAPFNVELQDNIPACSSPYANVVSTNGTLPGFELSGAPHFNAGQQPNQPHGWFYCLPRFRQAFTPALNSVLKDKFPSGPHENHEAAMPNPALGCAQKRFVVFDQSGEQTTLIFSPGVGAPVQCPTSIGPKLNSAYDLDKLGLQINRHTIQHQEPILTNEYNENHGVDMESEMHEDTAELDALLYSSDDDDAYSEDDEVASTGHSPSTMTSRDKQELLGESAEEVASSAGPSKRRKLFDGGYELPSLMDTATSVKAEPCFHYEDDAESSCADGKNQGLGEFRSLSGNKRLRKDNIRETVGILQSIIPGGKGKDAIAILDDAINYFKSLKHKAETLGLDTL